MGPQTLKVSLHSELLQRAEGKSQSWPAQLMLIARKKSRKPSRRQYMRDKRAAERDEQASLEGQVQLYAMAFY